MTSQLTVYNEALRFVGERSLASLSEDREPRHLLDKVWAEDAVDYCLEQGLWYFAIRSIEINQDTNVTVPFGYSYAFSRPDDFIRTAMVCTDERYTNPLLDYTTERDYWFSDLDPMYVKYISNDSEYGGDLSLWPQTFVRFVGAYMGLEIAPTLKKDPNAVDYLEGKLVRRLNNALAKDAMESPTTFPATGSWARSRRGNSSDRDGGKRNQLIG